MKWIKEIPRDMMAFGSIPFYFIVWIRSIIGDHIIFVFQLLIAIIALLTLSLIIKKSNQYIARALVIVIFTSLFYNDILFTSFAVLLWVLMVISALFMKVKKYSLVKGTSLGLISSIIAYVISNGIS